MWVVERETHTLHICRQPDIKSRRERERCRQRVRSMQKRNGDRHTYGRTQKRDKQRQTATERQVQICITDEVRRIFFFFLRSFAHSVRYSLTIAPTLFFYHADKNPNYDENKCNTVCLPLPPPPFSWKFKISNSR